MPKSMLRIEYPAKGTTYCKSLYGVYEYDTYPKSSVLAGQIRRILRGQYDTLEQAQQAHPQATYNGVGSGFSVPNLGHLPDGPDLI